MSPFKTENSAQDPPLNKLGALSISTASVSSSAVPTVSKLIVQKQGEVVPLQSTLEIQSRVSHKPIDLDDIAPQLWLSQTPKLVRAYHRNGVFPIPLVGDVAGAITSWEYRKQKDLRRLSALIQKIVSLAKEGGCSAVLKYSAGKDVLVLSSVGRRPMLPKDMYLKWEESLLQMPTPLGPEVVTDEPCHRHFHATQC